jgi:uncharacterized membrane protein (DUF106 family)
MSFPRQRESSQADHADDQSLLMQRTLIVIGVIFLVIGLLWPWLGKLPLGRLPGDIIIDRPNLKIYFPITTMVLISLVISLIMWLFRK